MFEGSNPLEATDSTDQPILPERIGFIESMDSLTSDGYVKPGTDLSDWKAIEPYFLELQTREITSADQLEQLLRDWSELESQLSEYGTRIKVALAQNTGNQIAEEREDRFLEEIEANIPEHATALYKKFLGSKFKAELDPDYYRVLIKTAETSMRLHTPENIELEIEEHRLVSEYERICSNLSCEVDGKVRTIPEVYPLLFSPGRELREKAWKAASASWQSQEREFEEIFEKLIKVREDIRTNARFGSFTEYAFLALERHDYTDKDCERFHHVVETHIVPLARRLYQERAERLGIPEIRPWDTEATGLTQVPLKPFFSIDQLCEKMTKVFAKIDPDFADQFAEMKQRGELDLEPRPGKTHCPFTEEYQASRRPFVFGNFTSTQDDVDTFAHECGHAFHYLASRQHDILEYRNAPLEFAEVASTTMEFLCAENLDLVYDNSKDQKAAKREFLEAKLLAFPVIAQIDAFQHWVYSNPAHSPEERRSAWRNLEDRFGFGVNWDGFESDKELGWHRRGHIFADPFYYIEYGLSQLGAMEIWLDYKKNPRQAVEQFRSALSLGGSTPVPELYKAAGASFDFSESRIVRLVNALKSELDALRTLE